MHKGGAIFDDAKLKWMNKEYMKKLQDAVLSKAVEERIPEALKNTEYFSERFPKVLPIIKERISYFGEVDEMAMHGELDYFFLPPVYENANDILPPEKMRKGKEVSVESTAAILTQAAKIIDKGGDIWPFAEEQGRGIVLWPLRFAL